MNKLYEKVNWQNEADGGTPLNARNLNVMDEALDKLDDRVIQIDARAPFVVNYSNELCMEVGE